MPQKDTFLFFRHYIFKAPSPARRTRTTLCAAATWGGTLLPCKRRVLIACTFQGFGSLVSKAVLFKLFFSFFLPGPEQRRHSNPSQLEPLWQHDGAASKHRLLWALSNSICLFCRKDRFCFNFSLSPLSTAIRCPFSLLFRSDLFEVTDAAAASEAKGGQVINIKIFFWETSEVCLYSPWTAASTWPTSWIQSAATLPPSLVHRTKKDEQHCQLDQFWKSIISKHNNMYRDCCNKGKLERP